MCVKLCVCVCACVMQVFGQYASVRYTQGRHILLHVWRWELLTACDRKPCVSKDLCRTVEDVSGGDDIVDSFATVNTLTHTQTDTRHLAR